MVMPKPVHEIRNARNADVTAIIKLWHELMNYHIALDPVYTCVPDAECLATAFLHKTIDDKDGMLLVAEAENGEIVAYILAIVQHNYSVYALRRKGYIIDLHVSLSARRHHIGETLCQAVCTGFLQMGITRVELDVDHANPLGQAFWEKMGFKHSIHRMARPL